MRGFWEDLQASRSTGLKLAAALAAVCVLAVLLVSVQAVLAAERLQLRIDRDFALGAAEQRLLTGLEHRDADRVAGAVRALLGQAEYGFRYLAVRDADGTVLAGSGRYESINRNTFLSPAMRRWLRSTLYTVLAESGRLTLQDEGRTLGTLEYAIGSPNARLVRDEAVDRLRTTGWISAILALLFGAAGLLLLRAVTAGGMSHGIRLQRAQEPARNPAGTLNHPPTALGLADDPLPQAFDAMSMGLLDIDAELRVRLINDTAAAMTGWRAEDALGQLIYTVFHARDDAGAPIVSPAEHCAREGVAQPLLELRLRPRGGSGRDVMVEARAMPMTGANRGARMVFQDVSERIAGRSVLQTQARIAEGVIDHLLEAVLTTDAAGVVKTANARALRIFGYSAEAMQRMTVARLLPVPFMNTPGLKLTDFMPGASGRMPKLAGWRKDATTFPAELVVEPMRVEGEDRLVVIIRDITEQTRSISLAQRLGRLLDAASEEVYIFDAQSLYFTEVNKGARRNLGLKAEQLLRLNLATIATDLEPATLQTYLARLRGGDADHITYKASHRRHDGSTYPVEVRLSFSRDEEPPVFMAIAQDISEREAAEKRMRQLAHYDALTNLPNRTLLFDRLKQAMHVATRGSRQLAVVFMDLDGFKPINDHYGHAAGDSVLQAVADRLNVGLRAADTVARFGGDEFVVLASGLRNTEDAMKLAEKVHELFKAPFDIQGKKITLSASVGITLYPADGADAEGLLRHADAAMYAAKQLGQGHTMLHALPPQTGVSEAGAAARTDLAGDIHSGLVASEFQLQFEPVLGATGEVTALRADYYWMHPELGRIDSEETLQVARRAGLHAEIELWLLTAALNEHEQAQQLNMPALPVLFPLTGRQWRDPDYPERVRQLVLERGVPPHLIILVIDGADWSDAADAVQMLWPQAAQQGLRIAVCNPDTAQTCDAAALVMLTLADESANEEVQLFERMRRPQQLGQTVVVSGIGSSGQWQRLRQAGTRLGCGSGVQAALTPLEFASWIGSRETKPL